MKTPLSFILAFTLLGFMTAHAADKSVLVRTCVYSVPKAAAAALLASPNLHTEPQSTIRTLRGMVAEKKASVVSNACVSGKLGNNLVAQAEFRCEARVEGGADGMFKLVIAVDKFLLGRKPHLLADLTVRRGETQFLGSLDDPAGGANTPTWILFVTVQ